MTEIRLDDATINVEGKWLTAGDLTRLIQEKMQDGDLKFTNLAAALEELNTALENSQTLDLKLTITADEYEMLKAFGGEDDRESVRKSILTYIGAADLPSVPERMPKKVVIKCPQCSSPIEIATDDRPVIIECQSCGTSGRLTAQNKWARLDQE